VRLVPKNSTVTFGRSEGAEEAAVADETAAVPPDVLLSEAVDPDSASPPHPVATLSGIIQNHEYRMLIASEVTREYKSGDQQIAVLQGVSFEIPQGGFVAIVGPSGSGKTTLLGLLAGLDTPTRGKVILDGHDLTSMSENERAKLRGE
jgi:putative ABC transport system ATP-binding protein